MNSKIFVYLIGRRSALGDGIYRSSYIYILAGKRHLVNLSDLGNICLLGVIHWELIILALAMGFLEFPYSAEHDF